MKRKSSKRNVWKNPQESRKENNNDDDDVSVADNIWQTKRTIHGYFYRNWIIKERIEDERERENKKNSLKERIILTFFP